MEITTGSGSSRSEIEEEMSSNDGIQVGLESIMEEIELASAAADDNVYYVAILGKSSDEEESSMDALVWTLNNIIPMAMDPPSSLVYLIHVFPQLHFIPTPLGKLPISRVNPEQQEKYSIQERGKRGDFLQKFLGICSSSKVKVETILIESDMEAKAILDLIPILNIRKLVLGTSKSTLRKLRSRKGNESTADQMLQNVPEFCELNIICEGEKLVFDDQDPIIGQQSPSPRPHNNNAMIENSINNDDKTTSPKLPMQEQFWISESFSCSCFKPKALA